MASRKGIWRRVKENAGFIFGFVGFLWWLGVTPGMVGQLVYDIGYFALPFVMLGSGIAIGWQLEKRHAANRNITAEHIRQLEDERDGLVAKVAFIESGPERAREKFQGLTLAQADLLNLAYGERNGFITAPGSKKYPAVFERPDIFTVFDLEDGRIRVSLTEEWAGLMNRHGDICQQVWQRRWAEAFDADAEVDVVERAKQETMHELAVQLEECAKEPWEKVEGIPEDERAVLATIAEMGDQAQGVVHQMYENPYCDVDDEWLNLVDGRRLIREVAHRVSSEPVGADVQGRPLYRWCLDAKTREAIGKCPGVFEKYFRLRDMLAECMEGQKKPRYGEEHSQP